VRDRDLGDAIDQTARLVDARRSILATTTAPAPAPAQGCELASRESR
jgi:hypothetical protein